MTQQVEIFHESLEDALCDIVSGTGGYKRVGSELWPDKSIDEAGRLLRNCLSENRPEKLSLGQLVWLLKRGHEHGIHTAMAWLADEVGYTRPEAITPDDQRDELKRQFIDAVGRLEQIQKRLRSKDGDVRAIR